MSAIIWIAACILLPFLLPPAAGQLLLLCLMGRAVWLATPAWRRPRFPTVRSPENDQLCSICRALRPAFDNIPLPKARMRDAEYFQTMHGTGAVVLAHYDPNHHRIEVNAGRYANMNWDERVALLKHELVHAWIHVRGIRCADPHGPEFQAKARAVGLGNGY